MSRSLQKKIRILSILIAILAVADILVISACFRVPGKKARVPATEPTEIQDETTEPEPCCAVVYYASSGEKVWDIAKRYHARVSAIRTHNDCMEDVLSEDRPVIICRK